MESQISSPASSALVPDVKKELARKLRGIIHRTKEKDKGTYCAAKISFMIVHYVENKSFFFVDKNSCPQRNLYILFFKV